MLKKVRKGLRHDGVFLVSEKIDDDREFAELHVDFKRENGYSELFEILLGTRVGGSEASLLFVLFIADLIDHLEKVALSSDPVKLAGKLIRALLLADLLAVRV